MQKTKFNQKLYILSVGLFLLVLHIITYCCIVKLFYDTPMLVILSIYTSYRKGKNVLPTTCCLEIF